MEGKERGRQDREGERGGGRVKFGRWRVDKTFKKALATSTLPSLRDKEPRPTCSICRTIVSGARSLMLPTKTVVTGGFSSFYMHHQSTTDTLNFIPITNAHDTCSRNRRNKSAHFSGAGLWYVCHANLGPVLSFRGR